MQKSANQPSLLLFILVVKLKVYVVVLIFLFSAENSEELKDLLLRSGGRKSGESDVI